METYWEFTRGCEMALKTNIRHNINFKITVCVITGPN